MLGPIEATWTKQQDKEHLQKKERESTNKGKGLCSKVKKRKLELERIENAIAKRRGYKYGHGIAFDETNVPEATEPTDPISEAAGATVVAGVGVPGVPPGTPFCNSCQTYGHSRITFSGCKKTLSCTTSSEAAEALSKNCQELETENKPSDLVSQPA